MRLVDWADEEGARFGRSLFGSSACSGSLVPDEEWGRSDKDGILVEDALARCGGTWTGCSSQAASSSTPPPTWSCTSNRVRVLEGLGLPLGVVQGTFGWSATASTSRGQAAHSGSTPMDRRRDAFLAAARMSPEIYAITDRNGGVCTLGSCVTQPGIVTSVVEACDITLDQRHLDAEALAAMLSETKGASERFAAEGDVEVSWSHLWSIAPILFHPELIALCDEAVRETAGASHRLPSGPLHDAAEVARIGIPTVMMFAQSLYGISHNKIEDTREEHIEQSVIALDKLAEKAMGWMG